MKPSNNEEKNITNGKSEQHIALGSRKGNVYRVTRMGLSLLVVAFIAIQFFPITRANPRVESDVPTSPELKSILRRACYDCHSNETAWPWYSYVAPASWLIADDVEEGREHLNFSTWNQYSLEEQMELRDELWEEVEEGEMPLWFYIPLHSGAKLSSADKELLRNWAGGSGQAPKAGDDIDEDEHETHEDED